MDIGKFFKEQEDYIIEMRRWFHRHPEISFEEEQTSAKIREELDKMGVEYKLLEPNHGLVAIINGDKTNKTIAVRADIDALPVAEETGFEFESKNQGKMHACGHDAHISMLLGAVKALNEVKDELNGRVVCVFQAAEEVGGGFQEILDFFESIGGVDEVIALHIWSTLPEGEILLIPGPVFAGASGFTVDVIGQGGHGARPDLVKDPIKAACDLVLKFSSIPSNYYDVLDHSVVTTCMINSGTMGNIFPSTAKITGSMRFFKYNGNVEIEKAMKRMAEGVGIVHDVKCDLQFRKGINAIINDAGMIERARGLVDDIDGLEVSPQTDPICASDNYGFLLEKYKGFYGILGAGSKTEYNYPQHHPKFCLEESTFRKGSEFMTRYVIDYLK